MAIFHLTPIPEPAAGDYLTLEEAVEFIRESGHPVSQSTVKRWAHRPGVRHRRVGGRGKLEISVDDLMRVHRDEVDKKLRLTEP